MTGFELHLQHEELPLPRNRDKVIMVTMMEVCMDFDQLKLMARVRVCLNAIFLSDITTADGTCIEGHALDENTEYVRTFSYNFPRESPTKED